MKKVLFQGHCGTKYVEVRLIKIIDINALIIINKFGKEHNLNISGTGKNENFHEFKGSCFYSFGNEGT